MLEHSSLLPPRFSARFSAHLRKIHIRADGRHSCISDSARPSRVPCDPSVSLRENEDLLAVSMALETQLFLSSWSVKLGRWNIQITDDAESGAQQTELVALQRAGKDGINSSPFLIAKCVPAKRKRHAPCSLWVQIPPLPLTLRVILNGDLRFGFSNP